MSDEQNESPAPEQHVPEQRTMATGNPYLVPVAIVIAGILVALAIMHSGSSAPTATSGGQLLTEEVLPVSDEDHILGSRDADLFLIEYSDYRCGYCGRYHSTIKQILEENNGRVSWVYRHTPYQPGGYEAAIAAECIAELAGEEAFWTYTDKALTNQADLSEEFHLETALELGVEQGAYEECVTSERHKDTIVTHTTNAQALDARGTPHTILMTRDGNYLPFAGALPIEQVRPLVERALSSLD